MVNIHENMYEGTESRKLLFNSHAIYTFLVGLKDPQTTLIRAVIHQYIIEEIIFRYLKL